MNVYLNASIGNIFSIAHGGFRVSVKVISSSRREILFQSNFSSNEKVLLNLEKSLSIDYLFDTTQVIVEKLVVNIISKNLYIDCFFI